MWLYGIYKIIENNTFWYFALFEPVLSQQSNNLRALDRDKEDKRVILPDLADTRVPHCKSW